MQPGKQIGPFAVGRVLIAGDQLKTVYDKCFLYLTVFRRRGLAWGSFGSKSVNKLVEDALVAGGGPTGAVCFAVLCRTVEEEPHVADPTVPAHAVISHHAAIIGVWFPISFFKILPIHTLKAFEIPNFHGVEVRL